MEVLFSIALTFVLVLVNGYFSMSEMALVSFRKPSLQQQADEGDKKARRALDIASDSDKLLATIQVAITLVGFGASASATATLAGPLSEWLKSFGIGWLSAISSGISVVLVTLVVSYVTLVLGELVPKRIALANPEKVSKSVAGFLTAFTKLAAPAVWLLAASTNGVAKLLGIKSADDRDEVTEEELKYLVTEQDTLLEEEKRMINEIFDLGDTVAREIMVPRVDMRSVEDSCTVLEAIHKMQGTGISRFPVCHESRDRIVGVVMIKDLISPLIDGRGDDPVTNYMREPMFVPDTKDILPLLGEMQTSHQQMVIVVDEYGGTAGLLTIEDIVEEIVGEISDEYDPDNKFLTVLSEGEWLADGRFPIDDALELGWPVEESEEYETVAGWFMDTVDLVPSLGEELEIGGYRFKVQSMRRNRISLLRVSKLAEEVSSEEPGEENEQTA